MMAGASTPPSTIMNAPAKKLQRVNATAQFEAGRRLRWDVTWLHIPKNAGTELESVALRGGLRWGRHVAWMNPRLNNRTSHAHWPAAVCRPPFRHSNSCCGWWHLPPQMLQDLRVKPDWWPAHLRYHSATHVVCVFRDPFERLLSEYVYVNGGGKGACCPINTDAGLTKLLSTAADGVHPFGVWVRELIRGVRASPLHDGCHALPQAAFIAPDWRTVQDLVATGPGPAVSPEAKRPPLADSPTSGTCNVVLRHSRLKDDFEALMQWLGLSLQMKPRKEMHFWSARAKQLGLSQDPRELLNATERQWVMDYYAPDFELVSRFPQAELLAKAPLTSPSL